MDRRAAFTEISRLCVSGVGSHLVVPAVIPLLGHWIKVESAFFFWTDGHGAVQELYVDPPPPRGLLELYAAEFHNRRDVDLLQPFVETMRSAPPVITLEPSAGQMQRSAFYHEILRPLDSGFQASVVLREGGRPLGLMALHRRRGKGAFAGDDLRSLGQLARLLTHAVLAPASHAPMTSSGEQAMLVLDERGRVLHAGLEARQLLAMAAPVGYWPAQPREHPTTLLSDPLSQLARRLVAAHDGRPGPPPVFTTSSRFGRFTFRAYPLEPSSADARRVGVVIDREVPLPFRIALAVARHPLSPRQKELCVHLAGGGTYREIAARMGISRHTVVEYVQAVYDRLGVTSRQEILFTLAATEAGA